MLKHFGSPALAALARKQCYTVVPQISESELSMGSSSEDDFITVVCTNPKAVTTTTAAAEREVLISVTDIQSWDLPAILCCQTLKVKADRNRLIQHSSYFHGLLSGSFSESGLDCIAIEWNLETFVDVLNCIYGCPLDVTFDNFLPLIEGALYFGVEMLLTKCKTWFSEVASSEVPPQMQLDDLIYIWSFGLEHGEKLSEIARMIRSDKNLVF